MNPRKRDARRVPPLGFSCSAAVVKRFRRGFRAERNGNRAVSKAFSSRRGNWACGRGQRRRAIRTGVELRPSAVVAAVTCAISVFAVLSYLPVTPGQGGGRGPFVRFIPQTPSTCFFIFTRRLSLFRHLPAGFRRPDSFEFGPCRGDRSEPAVLVGFFFIC